MTTRECTLAFVAMLSVALMLGAYAIHIRNDAHIQRQHADASYNRTRNAIIALHHQRTAHGGGAASTTNTTNTTNTQEDIIARIRTSLENSGIPSTAMHAVRPRQQRSINGGSANTHSINLELHNLTPNDLGTWLHQWNTPANPWHISTMNWRHNTQHGGNHYDIYISCVAVLVE